MKGKEKVSRKKKKDTTSSVFDEEEDKKPIIIKKEVKKPNVQGAPINFKVKGQIPMKFNCNYKATHMNPIQPALQSSHKGSGIEREFKSEGKRDEVPREKETETETMSSGVTGQEEDKKSNDQVAHINLKVKGQDGSEVFFRITRSTQLKKLMNAYCDRQSVLFNSIAFLFDGRRLRSEQTPDELKMVDGDEIDAMLHQSGGAR